MIVRTFEAASGFATEQLSSVQATDWLGIGTRQHGMPQLAGALQWQHAQ